MNNAIMYFLQVVVFQYSCRYTYIMLNNLFQAQEIITFHPNFCKIPILDRKQVRHLENTRISKSSTPITSTLACISDKLHGYLAPSLVVHSIQKQTQHKHPDYANEFCSLSLQRRTPGKL